MPRARAGEWPDRACWTSWCLRSVRWIERREVVAHVVLDRQRDIAAVERGLCVAFEVGVDLLVGRQGSVVRALPGAVALLRLAVSAGAGHVRRVAGPPETIEGRGDGRQVGPQVC